jgi:hypothetical protein
VKKYSKEFMELARRRFRQASEAEADVRKAALDDYQFFIGEGNQWPAHIRRERELTGDPCLEINTFPRVAAQVINAIRSNPPQITAVATENSDTEVAEIASGLLRRIQFEAGAEEAYTGAAYHAIIMGFGYFRIATDYADNDTANQDICIEEIRDPFSVYVDPGCRKKDYSDARYAFVLEDIDRAEFDNRFPGMKPSSAEDLRGVSDCSYWDCGEEKIRIAEYWYVEEKQRRKLLDGPGGYEDEIADEAVLARVKADEFKSRVVSQRKVKWCLIDGVQVIEEREWGSQYIGIVPVLGEEYIVAGRRYLHGMIRQAKDPQRMKNYWLSSATRSVALAPRAPFVAIEGQIEGREREWEESGNRNIAVLQYKQIDVGGKPAPPPQRQVYEPPVQAMAAMLQIADEQVKSATGIYAAALGDVGSEKSGTAIQARQNQSNTSNANFGEALRRALHHAGRIIGELIPVVYDTERVERILLPDMTSKSVKLNSPELDPKTGVTKVLNPATWKFDVQVSIGPTYATQRQAAAEGIGNLIKAFPPVMQFAGDLLVGSMDIPQAAEVAKRLKAMLPPNLQDQDGEGAQIPPQVQQQMQALMQQHEQLTAALGELTQQVKSKQAELDAEKELKLAELASREKIAIYQGEVDLVKTQATLDSTERHKVLEAELAVIKQRLAELSAERIAAQAPEEHREIQ